MDAYNLAICFGPTLMPAPEDKDQVQYQNQVNELIKNIIVHHAELFPKDLGGIHYEKFITSETFEDMYVYFLFNVHKNTLNFDLCFFFFIHELFVIVIKSLILNFVPQ